MLTYMLIVKPAVMTRPGVINPDVVPIQIVTFNKPEVAALYIALNFHGQPLRFEFYQIDLGRKLVEDFPLPRIKFEPGI